MTPGAARSRTPSVQAAPPEDGDVGDRFRHAMRRIASTVTLVTTCNGTVPYGATATSVTSVAMTPPSLLVCLHQQGAVRNRLAGSRSFCVNILKEGQEDLSRAFAGGLTQEQRFQAFGDQWGEEDGIPFLLNAQCAIFCSTEQALDWGTHTIFLGGVRKVRLGSKTGPLLYCDGGFARLERSSAQPAATAIAIRP